MVSCGYCRAEFDEDRGQPGCRACPLGSDCGLIRCPECGYENPGTPPVVTFFKKLFGRAPKPPEPVVNQRPGALPVMASGSAARSGADPHSGADAPSRTPRSASGPGASEAAHPPLPEPPQLRDLVRRRAPSEATG